MLTFLFFWAHITSPQNHNALSQKVDEERVERVFKSLTTREKAAQLLLAYPQVNKSTPVEVGGVLFVGSSLKNLNTAKERIASLKSRAKVPPFFAADMEGGPTNRLKSLKEMKGLPTAQELGRLDDGQVFEWGKRVGAAMRSLGLNMNLAPVLDVSKSGHMADNGRSFGAEPDLVVAKASAFAKGLLHAGVVPIGKHYPGYGSTAGDTDHARVVAEWPKEQIDQHVNVFERAKDVLGGVMLANVIYSAYGDRPAILTDALVEKVHRNSWLSMTDDISIQRLADSIQGSTEDVLVGAFLAGNDMLLTTAPPDWDQGLDYVGVLTRLAASDPKAMKRLEGACRRILRLKDKMGLLSGL